MTAVSKKIKCPNCGQIIGRSGLISHRRGASCLVAATIRRYVAKGWGTTSYANKSLLEIAGVRFGEGPAAWNRGFNHQYSKMVYALYAPTWAVEVLEHTTYRHGGPYFKRTLRIELLRTLRRSKDARKVFRSAVNLKADFTTELIRTVIDTKGDKSANAKRQA